MPRAFLINKKKARDTSLSAYKPTDATSVCSDGHSDDRSDHSDVDIDVVGHDDDDVEDDVDEEEEEEDYGPLGSPRGQIYAKKDVVPVIIPQNQGRRGFSIAVNRL